MKFEQLLQIYWSRGFLYSGKVRSFNTTLTSFFDENLGMSEYVKKQFVKRFEINHFIAKREESFTSLTLERRKIINMYLSRIISINNNINELIKYNLIMEVVTKIVTFGGLNKLEVYRRLNVKEVWFWQNERFSLYDLRSEIPVQFVETCGYEQIDRSEILPNLDIELLAAYVRYPNSLAAVKEFRQRLIGWVECCRCKWLSSILIGMGDGRSRFLLFGEKGDRI